MKDAPPSEPDWPLRVILTVSLACSVFCLVQLWRGRGNVFAKVVWSVFVFVPLLGPVFFGVIYQPPSAQPEGDQLSSTSDAEHLS